MGGTLAGKTIASTYQDLLTLSSASDKDGSPLDIGLNREKGHPILDSRQIDGFKCLGVWGGTSS